MQTGQRVALLGMAVSAALAVTKIVAGLAGHSTAVVADGCESASDVFSSGFVLLGLTLAAKPADREHPYGHGRIETLTGMLIGLVLTAAGAVISAASFEHLGQPREALDAFVLAPLVLSALAKSGLAGYKFRVGRKLGSAAITADAWHDTVDIVSAVAAMAAVGLTLVDPTRFGAADRYGGMVVGLIVIFAGVQVVRDTAMQLIDTMPDPQRMDEIRQVAATVDGVRGVEKCFARKTGLRYHVDLHLEVDPDMTVRSSHEIAHKVQLQIKEKLDWVADVLVHVEPGR
ncbi:MAG TPA: cation diffusion facilitator family transporter [Bryobacteraceae bacterium]|jgi:cation diffusion facilitator family transporter|nr:cation diffusion facilitator family transporter [Bryobacteraceae bacterium]